MKKIIAMAIIAFFYVGSALAQTSDEKPKLVSESMYILPKKGMFHGIKILLNTQWWKILNTRNLILFPRC